MSTKGNQKSQIQQKHKIFISYASEDDKEAYHLYNELEKYDNKSLQVFIDKESLLGGEKWKDAIEKAIKRSQYFVLLLSKNSIAKNTYVQKELRVALQLAKKLPKSKVYIIPIRLDDCDIPESIQDFHIINLFPDWKKGFQRMLNAMKLVPPKKLAEGHWENLLDAITQGKCIPIIGESVLEYFNQVDDPSFITSEEVATKWAEEYNYPLAGPYQLPKVAQFLAIDQANEKFPKETMSRIIGEMKTPNFSSDQYNRSPYAILAELEFPIYITTNYDLFLEEALKSQGKDPQSEICRWNEELLKSSKKGYIPAFKKSSKDYPTVMKPLVFHFHGSIDNPSSMVLTERDLFEFVIYTNQSEFEKEGLAPFLRTALANSSLIFIGYSLDDLNFRSIFQGGLSFMSSINKDRNSIAAIQFPSIENENIEESKLVSYFEKYTDNMFKIIVYWGEPNDFLEELLSRWKEIKKKGS